MAVLTTTAETLCKGDAKKFKEKQSIYKIILKGITKIWGGGVWLQIFFFLFWSVPALQNSLENNDRLKEWGEKSPTSQKHPSQQQSFFFISVILVIIMHH